MTKEPYLTAATIDRDASGILADIAPYTRNRAAAYDPAHAALLVLDMQKYFLDPASHAFAPAAPVIVPGVLSLIAAFERTGRPVICTRHLDGPDPSSPMLRWWRGRVVESDPASTLIDGIASSQPVLHKHAYDAFQGTTLEATLRSLKITQVVVVGVLTHLCVESTARAAFMRGFDVMMPVEGSATYTRDLHVGALRGLAHGFANMTRIADIRDAHTA